MPTKRKPAIMLIAVLALGLGVLATSQTWAGGDELRLRARFVAPVSAGDVSGQAKFRYRNGRRQFSAEIEGFNDGDMFDVMVSGVVVGKIVINEFGDPGDLNFDDNFEPGDDDPATQFPANFPALDGGELVEIGLLRGALQND